MLWRKNKSDNAATEAQPAGEPLPDFRDRDLATAFSAMEIATVGLDAVASAVGDARGAVEAASRTANMTRRALLAARYETLRGDIARLEEARRHAVREILSRAAETTTPFAQSFDPDAEPATTLRLAQGVEGFRDAAVIDAARHSLAAARATLDRLAGHYRDCASAVADRMVELGESGHDWRGFDDLKPVTDEKRPSLGDRLLRGLFGGRAA